MSAKSVPPTGWVRTVAHERVLVITVLGLLTAILVQRVDVAVLTVPFLTLLVWSGLTRPHGVPSITLAHPPRAQIEGRRSGIGLILESDPQVEMVSYLVHPSPWVTMEAQERSGVQVLPPQAPSRVSLPVKFCPERWGLRSVGPIVVSGASAWGAYRWGPSSVGQVRLSVRPRYAPFRSSSPAPHPRGLAGAHRARPPGHGAEFASIRAFQWGDRLKRIHWPRSLSTGQLQVTTTHADRDTRVAILLDAHYDVGRSGGVNGPGDSSLDVSVRSSAAIAEYFLHHGDRVSLHVLSAAPVTVQPANGRSQLLRILEALVRTVPGPRESEVAVWSRERALGAGTLVIMVSALLSPPALTLAASLARSRLSVIVVDTLTQDVQPRDPDDPLRSLAWRIRLIERDREIRRVGREGVPVVPWVGPGSLDRVLVNLGRSRG